MQNAFGASTLSAMVFLCVTQALSDTIIPINKIISDRHKFYKFKGSVSIETIVHDVDYLKECNIVLNTKMEAALKNKRTDDEIMQSMATYKYGEPENSVSEYVASKLKAPKRSHVFKIIKIEKIEDRAPSQKDIMLYKLYHNTKKKDKRHESTY